MSDYKITDTVDITDVVCPVTFVKAKVALDELEVGEILSIRLNDGEPVANVPRSIKEEGHKILKLLNDIGVATDDLSEVEVRTRFHKIIRKATRKLEKDITSVS